MSEAGDGRVLVLVVEDEPLVALDLETILAQAGFVVIDLTNWSEGHAPGEVKLSPTDHHANARGHQVIAERLQAVLRERPQALPPCGRNGR